MTIFRTIGRTAFGLCGLVAVHATPVSAQVAVRIESGMLVLPTEVQFETGTATITQGSEAGLAQVVQFLTEKSYVTLLRVETNAAALADREANLALGKTRAQRLAAWFGSHGVDCKRLIFVTFGPDKPMVAGKGAVNERVEFRPATLRDRAIGGLPVDGGGLVVQAPCP